MKKIQRFSIFLVLSLYIYSPLTISKTINAVASFSILTDIIEQVGGEHIKVSTLIKPNGDLHSYSPSPQDSKLLLQSDIVFINGLGLEGWIDRLISASGYRGRLVIASHGIHTRTIDGKYNKIIDPHVWNNMNNGIHYVTNVMNALIATDPKDMNYFKKRGKEYIHHLQQLDIWAKTQFAAVPLQKRKVLTSHDAFGYFGHEYGITFITPVGLDNETETSASDLARLIKQIKKEKINTYFIDNQTNDHLVKQIAEATGMQVGGTLYPETLSNTHGLASTYTQTFKHNVNMLLNSMQCIHCTSIG